MARLRRALWVLVFWTRRTECVIAVVVLTEPLPECVPDRGERLARPLDLTQLLGGQLVP
ncbi:hypothetical protein [Streptomyces sp. NPDC052496]|uniref:hypothetical protein n=1 Tax=Streptomyces sp. NPDC052496 TaxID=3154951 RepID=UPI00343C3BFB